VVRPNVEPEETVEVDFHKIPHMLLESFKGTHSFDIFIFFLQMFVSKNANALPTSKLKKIFMTLLEKETFIDQVFLPCAPRLRETCIDSRGLVWC
jgi:hypothetical protein